MSTINPLTLFLSATVVLILLCIIGIILTLCFRKKMQQAVWISICITATVICFFAGAFALCLAFFLR